MRRMIASIFVLFAVASAGLLTISSSSSNPSPPRSAATGKHYYYVYPQWLQDKRNACFRTEREERGIPGERNAYIAWWNAHEGTAFRDDWSAAYDACKKNNPLPGGPWNWSAMVLVRVEG
jgi:hypothetical protein